MDLKVNNTPAEHIPVLAETITQMIDLPQDALVVDATVGYGGHSKIFGQKLNGKAVLLGLDFDWKCLESAKNTLAQLKCKVLLRRANFARIGQVFEDLGLESADLIFADLGVCSAQLADTEKGLSFQRDSKLDMRLDDRGKITAADIVNYRDENGLADLIYEFGQERASRKIARSIVCYRKDRKISSTAELSSIICRALKVNPASRKSKIHPATRTFQALRIAVNNELENLKALLAEAPRLLKKNGKVAVISFHSLEDRIVKYDFKDNASAGIYQILTKKPVTASPAELTDNPRARSAKLRIAQKL